MKEEYTEFEILEDFLKWIDSIWTENTLHEQTVTEKDAELSDIVHSLELDDLRYKERAKLATKLARNRTDRRISKNFVQLYEPLIKFLSDESNRRAINKLKIVLGELRKRSERLENRVYVKRAR